MPYRYRCDHCRTTSPTAYTRAGAYRERQHHRDQAHGGHRPDREHLEHVRRWQAFDYRDLARTVAFFLALPVADWIWRHR